MAFYDNKGNLLNYPIKWFLTQEQVNEGVRYFCENGGIVNGHYNYDIAFFGDSLTFGLNGGGVTYPAVMANVLGASHINMGVSGATTFDIACTQGGTHAVLPANTDLNEPFPLTDNYGKGLFPQYASKAQGLFYNKEELSITHDDYINWKLSNSETLTSPRYIYTGFSANVSYKSMVIFLGTNDVLNSINSDTTLYLNVIRDMVRKYGGKQYIIVGLFGDDTKYDTYCSVLKEHFGSKYFNSKQYLSKYATYDAINQGLLNESVLTDDVLNSINSGIVPSTMKSDPVHLNAVGYRMLGQKLAEKFLALGYQP